MQEDLFDDSQIQNIIKTSQEEQFTGGNEVLPDLEH